MVTRFSSRASGLGTVCGRDKTRKRYGIMESPFAQTEEEEQCDLSHLVFSRGM